jgi:hypothetical protein
MQRERERARERGEGEWYVRYIGGHMCIVQLADEKEKDPSGMVMFTVLLVLLLYY